MKREVPAIPTGDECQSGARVADVNGMPAFACWYPQMGGYVGKCVVVVEHPNGDDEGDSCFDAYVWHDGEFPFHEVGEMPARIHHCSAQQFIDFGRFVLDLQSKGPATQ